LSFHTTVTPARQGFFFGCSPSRTMGCVPSVPSAPDASSSEGPLFLSFNSASAFAAALVPRSNRVTPTLGAVANISDDSALGILIPKESSAYNLSDEERSEAAAAAAVPGLACFKPPKETSDDLSGSEQSDPSTPVPPQASPARRKLRHRPKMKPQHNLGRPNSLTLPDAAFKAATSRPGRNTDRGGPVNMPPIQTTQ